MKSAGLLALLALLVSCSCPLRAEPGNGPNPAVEAPAAPRGCDGPLRFDGVLLRAENGRSCGVPRRDSRPAPPPEGARAVGFAVGAVLLGSAHYNGPVRVYTFRGEAGTVRCAVGATGASC